MTNEEFALWALQHGVTFATVEQLILVAATPEDMRAAEEAIQPPPPICSLDDIKQMNEGDDYGFRPFDHGLMLIGGCPSGDPIAVDIEDAGGSVFYLDHTAMFSDPPRKTAVRVADDVESLINGMAYEKGFPFDHYDAKQRGGAGR